MSGLKYRLKRFVKIATKFAIVGVSGIGVNFLVYTPLIYCGVKYYFAAVASFLVAGSTNYLFNSRWTFSGYGSQKPIVKYTLFIGISAASLVVNIAVLHYLMQRNLCGAIFAQLVGIVAASASNFLLNYFVTFEVRKGKNV